MPMKKLYLPCWLFIVCSIALVPAASAADAETPAPGASQSVQEQIEEEEELNDPTLWPEERKRLKEKRRLEREAAQQRAQEQQTFSEAESVEQEEYNNDTGNEYSGQENVYDETETRRSNNQNAYNEYNQQENPDGYESEQESHQPQQEYASQVRYPEQTLEEIPIEEFQ